MAHFVVNAAVIILTIFRPGHQMKVKHFASYILLCIGWQTDDIQATDTRLQIWRHWKLFKNRFMLLHYLTNKIKPSADLMCA
jgi:hypothetical protein